MRRSTNLRRIVLETRKEQVDPMMVAEATMNQPSGKPYTNPAVVTHVEYPIRGGNDTKNVAAHKMSQPPGRLFQLSAKGSNQPNMLWLKTRNKIVKTRDIRQNAIAATLCMGDIF